MSVAGVTDGEDNDYRVGITTDFSAIRVVVLVVDPRRAGQLVMYRARPAWTLRPTRLAAQVAGACDSTGASGVSGRMIPELACLLEPYPVDELLVVSAEASVYQNSVSRG